jgi:GTP-binding protein Era
MNDTIDSQNNIVESATIPVAPEGYRSGFIAIIGRPNVGKSTLMNRLVGQKIAITSPVAQTTRNRLRGILTTDRAQMIFVDTPGIHKPHHELGRVIVKNAENTIGSVDTVLFVVDSTVPVGGGDRYIADLLAEARIPIIVGLNKADEQPADGSELDAGYRELIGDRDWPLLKFSALTGEGLEELENCLIDRLDPGPYYYPPDLVTDQPERFIMGELIREQILLQTRQEIPHSVAVVIERVEESREITRVFAAINVERDSQKGIIIGKNGSMLRTIGTSAREAIGKLIAGEVYLKLFVKVEPKWRQLRARLAEFGYRDEE